MARRLFGQLLLPLTAIAVLTAALFGAMAFLIMDGLYGRSMEESLGGSAQALAAALPSSVLAALPPGPAEGLQDGSPRAALGDRALADLEAWSQAVATSSGYRLTLVLQGGAVAADTEADPALMENHASRPEVAEALAGRVRTARRRSATLGAELFYAAAPVYRAGGWPGQPSAALRVAADLPAVLARLRPARGLLALALALICLVALLAASFVSRRISAPLRALADAASAMAGGDRSRSLPLLRGPEEVAILARGLAAMAAELDARVRETEAESRERAAILDGMAEAVLALDREFRVRVANPAARLLFGFGEGESPIGEALLRVTRSVELQSAAEACLRGGGPLETELAIYGEAERWFQAFVAPLAAIAGGATGGLVIVLNNITRLRRLERVRKDFVANVSHELRTPIHLIKGFTEALAEGALEDPAQARRFLEIMEGNAARMESLIDDLLTLARLEQEGEAWLQCEVVGVAALLEEAVAAVLPKAEDRGIEIGLSAPADLEARVNAGLLVQAVVNLLDNAVKYSPPGSRVSVAASRTDEEDRFLIEVSDRGMGIPAKDLPRIFERFYRVDKARSKELGGTGLGLAIVRHIALAHEGSVSVESVAGEGSRFALRLPLAGPRAPARPAQV